MFPYGVIFIGVTLLLALKLWLDYCLKIDERHRDNLVHAQNLIAATGRGFPLRSLFGTGVVGTLLSAGKKWTAGPLYAFGESSETPRGTVVEQCGSTDS